MKALAQRKEKMEEVVEHTESMREQSSIYEEAAKALREKYTNQKWWQL